MTSIAEIAAELERNAVDRYRIVLREQIRAMRYLTTDDREMCDEILALIDVPMPSERPEEVTPTSDLSPATAAGQAQAPKGEPAGSS